jgi:hypothetical protein
MIRPLRRLAVSWNGILTLPLSSGDYLVNLAGDNNRIIAHTFHGERWKMIMFWNTLVIGWRIDE